MADATALIQNLILVPGRFGSPNLLTIPKDGIEGSEHHNVASTNEYRVGTICQLWHPGVVGVAGWSEFVYAKVGTADTTTAFAGLILCHPQAITDMFEFTDDPDVPADQDTAFYETVCLTAVTAGRYAWFWSGGVCPCDLVTLFTATATYHTDDSVVVGAALEVVNLTGDYDGLGIGDGTKPAIATSTVGD